MESFIVLIVGFIHGVNEGMDMHKPNVREHRWFIFYHRLYVFEALLLIWFGYRLYPIGLGWWILPVSILANRAMEIGYGLARYNKPFPDYENVLGTGFVVTDKYAHLLQFGLLLLGIFLTVFMRR